MVSIAGTISFKSLAFKLNSLFCRVNVTRFLGKFGSVTKLSFPARLIDSTLFGKCGILVRQLLSKVECLYQIP